LHQRTHWGIQGLCDQFLQEYLCLGVYPIAKSVTKGCIVCQRVNQKVMRKSERGGRDLAIRPFQAIQIDFTEMPQTQTYKHILVIIDHLTHWVEAYPTRKETADVVIQILLEEIIPRYGIVNVIDSDRGPHFSAEVLQQVMKALNVKWELHVPWHPQSSGRVERVNKTLKNVLTKLIEETKLNWVKCLPVALLRIRTRPRADLGVSPYEMLFGLPFLTSQFGVASYQEGEGAVYQYLKTISKTLTELRQRGYIPQTPPLDSPAHKFQVGDWVLIKSWNS
ncbi:YI31B protein, partial [Podargus strigoides]|nr:YI31B protein [Podargus strigoides]